MIIGFTKDGEQFAFEPGLSNLNKITLRINNKEVPPFFKKGNEVERFIDQKTKEMAAKGKGVLYIPYTRLSGDTVFFKNNHSTEIGNVGFGGKLYQKAISRIAVNFYLLLKESNLSYVKDLITELGQDSTPPRSRFYYSDTNLLIDSKEGEVSHTIVLKGNPKNRILFAYIDLFSCHSHLINLNSNYNGPPINYTYSYDCIKGVEIDKAEWLCITRPELTDYHLFDHEKSHSFSRALHERKLNNYFETVQRLHSKSL